MKRKSDNIENDKQNKRFKEDKDTKIRTYESMLEANRLLQARKRSSVLQLTKSKTFGKNKIETYQSIIESNRLLKKRQYGKFIKWIL